jgi:glycosyltransferase involved in cell wall biosynthesis
MSAVRTVALAASVSRLAGGPFESIRGLAAGLRLAGAAVDVLGIRDAFTADDLAAWAPLEPLVFDRRGPASFGYAPGYGAALHRLAPAIVHSHGLWMYPSLAALRWHNRTGRPYVVSPHGMLDPWALAHHRRRKQVVRPACAPCATASALPCGRSG